MVQPRFLLITYPIQGHVNPSLQFAKRLAAIGVHVTFATSVYLHRRMLKKPTVPGLSFVTFSDGYDDGYKPTDDSHVNSYMAELKRRGSEFLGNIITSAKEEGKPFTCLTYTLMLPWVAKVAREFRIPGVLLWIQAATVLDIYYHYFHGYKDYINTIQKSENSIIEFPGLPFSLATRDIPSFLLPSNAYSFAIPPLEEQFKLFDEETNHRVLVNTFQDLEPEALKAIDNKLTTISIGPLIPSAFLDGKDPTDTSFGADIYHGSNDYIEWLDSKPALSVVYVSFGTLAVLSQRQMEEIARALLDSGYPFLWVIREPNGKQEKEEKSEELSCRKELEQKGKIVNWCSQVEVLSHGSLGCFLTHCGWNSTMESLSTGIPMVSFPQWSDQGTNAKLVEDVWKTGVRVDGKANAEGIVEGEEIRKCLEVVMGNGEKRDELRRNAEKWKCLAREAVKEGGSSDRNIRTFLDYVAGLDRIV